MPRLKRRGPKARRTEVAPEELTALLGLPPAEGEDEWLAFMFDHPDIWRSSVGIYSKQLREAWEFGRDDLLAEWIAERPGTRPVAWWEWDAPRWEDTDLPDRRRRLGGPGDLASDCLAYAPRYHLGLPTTYFIDARDLETWPGLRNRRTDEPARAFDPDDPPRFESEAAYLKRRGLLVDGEEERIPAEGFEPITVAP